MTKEGTLRLEQKFAGPDGVKFAAATGEIEGDASRFGEVDKGRDVVMPGAFKSALARGPKTVKMLWQHDPHQPIGVWEEMEEDATGLRVKGRLILDVAKAREAAALLDAGAIEGLSIGYRTEDAVSAMQDGKAVRQLKAVDLWEVSLVTFPMLPTATVRSRKAEDWQDVRFVEQYLRDGGCSVAAAKAIAAHGVKAGSREAGAGTPFDLAALDAALTAAMKG